MEKRMLVYIVEDRIPFCSRACVAAALEGEPEVRNGFVSTRIAAVIKCYGCGLYLDETR